MKRNNNKGFTLTELLIVIVIIGVLVAILIPVLTTYINKSKTIEKEKEIVKNINTALKSDENIVEGEQHRTMYEALQVAKAVGYDVEKINNSKYTSEILWDSKNDVFCYLSNGKIEYIPEFKATKETLDVDYFRIANDYASTDKKYSVYLSGDSFKEAIENVTTGLDVGENENIPSISYVGKNNSNGAIAQDVIIRTNGGKLDINAPKDVVKHYGSLTELHVQAIANMSYHEYGDVIFAAIRTGHISFEENSSIEAIHIIANEEQKFDPIIISYKEEVEQPNYSRDYCEIEPEGTKVCTLSLPEETNNIILFKQGIYEQIKLQPTTVEVEQSATSSEEKVWITENENATEETKVASDQLANIYGNRTSALTTVEGQDTPELDNEKDFVVPSSIDVVVSDKPTAEEKKNEVLVSFYVRAQVDNINLNKDTIKFDLWEYNNITDSAFLDVAYLFKGFTDEEYVVMEKLINAKDENGNNIFSIDNIDISSLNDENLEKALAAVERDNGLATRKAAEKIISQKSQYFNWLCDFEVSFDKNIEEGTVALAGYYGAFAENYNDGAWLGFGTPAVIATDEPIKLLDTMYQMTKKPDFHMPYIAILAIVQEFSCGVTNLSADNVGTTITVELCIYNYDEEGNQTDRIVCGTYQYTFGEVSEANQLLIAQKNNH